MGAIDDVVALPIAVAKAALVPLFFVKLEHSPALTRLMVVAGALWLVVPILISMSDVLTRDLTIGVACA